MIIVLLGIGSLAVCYGGYFLCQMFVGEVFHEQRFPKLTILCGTVAIGIIGFVFWLLS